MKILVITTEEIKTQDINPNHELQELQTIVGGYIEPIKCTHNIVAYVNEDGRLLKLPINNMASKLLSYALAPGQQILGNVAVCEIQGENHTNISPESLKIIEENLGIKL